MANPGIAPLDPTTDVGRLRALLADTSYVPLDPPVAGQGGYAIFSDADLIAYLALGSADPLRSAAIATRRLALEYSAKGKSVKTDDLAIDLRSRGKDLLEVAESFDSAANSAAESDANDYFNIVPFGDSPFGGHGHAEGALWPSPAVPTPPASHGLDGGSP